MFQWRGIVAITHGSVLEPSAVHVQKQRVMIFDFDTPIVRRGSGCIKFDRQPWLDPFWVADMDFASAPVILEALHRRVDHGVFGYAQAHDGLNEAILAYLHDRHHVTVPLEHITLSLIHI